MLADIYIAAVLIDIELADQIWEAWNSGLIDDAKARLAWLLLADASTPGDDLLVH